MPAERGPDQTAEPGGTAAAGAVQLYVGIGASAGGVAALRSMFAEVPRGAGVGYVVVLHLSPDYESHLTDVLQAVSRLPVTQVTAPVTIEPDHVYVVPPNRTLAMTDGAVAPREVVTSTQRRSPIDVFLHTLAEAQGPRSVAVILSGTGSDGTAGAKRIKERGGLVIAQEPGSAEHREMPQQLVSTGLADLVLTPDAIPQAVVQFAERWRTTAAPVGDVPPDVDALRDIVTVLRVRTGHDFSCYKPGTVMRRIARRMSVRQVASLPEYARVVREQVEEPAALMKDLLISVTSFFRDPAAYAVLEQRVIPQLFVNRTGRDQVRVWCAGCATGEEAYSVAMLLAERLPLGLDPPHVQVFATDLDEDAIAAAREGLYKASEVAGVPEERLQRFFLRSGAHYRVRSDLREMVLFAKHDLIKDPPFSHLDLIVCRNLLIYLTRAAQQRVLEVFHFALRPGRYLFLGASELPEGGEDLYVPVDRAAHVFETRTVGSRLPVPQVPAAASQPTRPFEAAPPERTFPADLHLKLLEQYAPPSLVVNEDFKVVHLSAGVTRYLQIPPGEPTRDLMALVHPALRLDLRAALQRAARERRSVVVSPIAAVTDAGAAAVKLLVRPALGEGDPPRGFFLVLFEEDVTAGADALRIELPGPAAHARDLDEELTRVRQDLRSTIEQYETQVEEAKAANEELQALNEELRSSAEELETSQEELQSVNEELSTVNQELKVKIEELALSNDDIRNFVNSTEVASVFLDRQLRVKLATPRVRDIFNLMPADRGRRVSDITTNLVQDTLRDDIRAVLEDLRVVEREVQTREGQWFLMRALPYRTPDERIEGVVLTFVNITSRRAAEERLRLLIESATDYAIVTLSADGVIDSWNSGAQRVFGYTASEAVGRPVDVLFTPEDRAAGVPQAELATAAEQGCAADERWHIRRDGSRLYCSGVTTRLGEGPLGFAKIARDLTAQRTAEDELRRAHELLEQRVAHRTQELEVRVRQHAAAEAHVTTLLRQLVTAQEDERARVARDLHDHLGQQVTALRLALERHGERCRAENGDLGTALDLAAAIDRAVDFLAWELRPAALDHLGLAAALPRYVQEWTRHFRIAAEFRIAGFTEGDLSPDAQVAFYRVAQEALNNVIKHAHASRVDVLLERRDGRVTLVVEDDGSGFDGASLDPAAGGLGLLGMRERARLIGGVLDVETSPGTGTTVYLRCPAAS